MSNAFPDTPVSLLACLEERRAGMPYQDAWTTFFDLYHAPLKLAVLAAFRRSNWYQVPDDMVEETIADVVVSFFKAEFSYDPAKGRFRNYLRQLASWRVCDKLGKLPKIRPDQTEPLEALEAESPDSGNADIPGDDLLRRELATYQSVLLATMLEDVKNRVSPQTFLMFELVKIQGQSPEEVAKDFRVKRNVVDNASYRVLTKLRELASQPEYQKEYLQ